MIQLAGNYLRLMLCCGLCFTLFLEKKKQPIYRIIGRGIDRRIVIWSCQKKSPHTMMLVGLDTTRSVICTLTTPRVGRRTTRMLLVTMTLRQGSLIHRGYPSNPQWRSDGQVNNGRCPR